MCVHCSSIKNNLTVLKLCVLCHTGEWFYVRSHKYWLDSSACSRCQQQSASQSDCFSDDESEVSVQSTLKLSSSSGGCTSDDSFSSGKERTSTPIPKIVSTGPVSVLSNRKAHLPSGFVIPSKFGKVTDGHLKSGNITDVDRAKVKKLWQLVCGCIAHGLRASRSRYFLALVWCKSVLNFYY